MAPKKKAARKATVSTAPRAQKVSKIDTFCAFCKRPRRISQRSAEENPFCNLCLHERVAESVKKAKEEKESERKVEKIFGLPPKLPAKLSSKVVAARIEDLNLILRDEWNPIGFSDVLPRDEYDSYARLLFSRFWKEPRATVIAAFLSWLRCQYLSCPPPTGLNWGLITALEDAKVAEKIVSVLESGK